MKQAVKTINDYLLSHNCWDFAFSGYDGANLLLVGSFDLSYYHLIEIEFIDVHAIAADTMFSIDNGKPVFFHDGKDGDGDKISFLDDNGKRGHVICENLAVRIGLVKYFDEAGNRIPGK